MKKKFIVPIIMASVIVVSSMGFYFMKQSKVSAVQTSSYELMTIPGADKVYINGEIVPENSENIYLDSSKGNLNKTYVQNGQVVKKGDKLFDYKNQGVTEQIEEANRQLNLNYKEKKLLNEKKTKAKQKLAAAAEESKAVVESEITALDDQLTTLQNQISSLEEQLSSLKKKEYVEQTAAFDGKIIIDDAGKKGQVPYIVLESINYYINGSITEKDQPKISLDKAAEILVLSTNKTITGKIKEIGNRPVTAAAAVEGASAATASSNISSYNVKIALDSQDGLVNGFHVQATAKLSEQQIKIPVSATFTESDKKYVFISKDNVLTKQEIACAEESNGEVVVNSGLKENDEVILNYNPEMKEGSLVE